MMGNSFLYGFGRFRAPLVTSAMVSQLRALVLPEPSMEAKSHGWRPTHKEASLGLVR